MSETPHIVIGDDHPLVQAALQGALSRAFPGAAICAAATIDDVLGELAKAPRPVDLVLLDLSMPGNAGLSGLMRIHATHPETPIAIFSARDDAETVRAAIRLGACGYIPKTLAMTAIAQAIEQIMAGALWIPPGVDLSTPQDGDAAARLARLTPQQLRILTLMVEGKLNKQIAGELGVAEQTVKAHVSTILRKLKVVSRTQAAIMVERTAGKVS